MYEDTHAHVPCSYSYSSLRVVHYGIALLYNAFTQAFSSTFTSILCAASFHAGFIMTSVNHVIAYISVRGTNTQDI